MKPALMIGIPLKSFDESDPEANFTSQFRESYADTVRTLHAFDVSVLIMAGGGICRARNLLVAKFLSFPGALWLLMVDQDILWRAEHVVALLKANKAVIGGLYSTREENCHWVANFYKEPKPDAAGVLEVAEVGTGFKLFHRRIFDHLIKTYPEIEYTSDDTGATEHAFFQQRPVVFPQRTRFLTEDFWFDHLCHGAKTAVYAHTAVKLKHLHEGKSYPMHSPQCPWMI